MLCIGLPLGLVSPRGEVRSVGGERGRVDIGVVSLAPGGGRGLVTDGLLHALPDAGQDTGQGARPAADMCLLLGLPPARAGHIIIIKVVLTVACSIETLNRYTSIVPGISQMKFASLHYFLLLTFQG